MSPWRALVVDDEPFVRADLRELLRAHPDVEVVGEAATPGQARALLRALRPGVVFLDVQLRGGSGFELLPDLGPSVEVIFVTASDRHAVRAFEVNALDYLMKPVAPARLAEAVARLGAGRPTGPLPSLRPDDRILVKHDAGQRLVPVAEVRVVESMGGNYTILELRDGARLTVRRSLAEWQQALPPAVCRASRAALANLALAERLERGPDDGALLWLQGRAAPLAVSRRRAAALRAALAALAGAPAPTR